MRDDDWDDDYEDDEFIEEEFAPCPKCGANMPVDAEMCPSCGHWLTTAERHKLWDAGSKTKAGLSMGKTLLVIILVALFVGSMFGLFR